MSLRIQPVLSLAWIAIAALSVDACVTRIKGGAGAPGVISPDLESWIALQRRESFDRLLRNVAPGVPPFTRRVEAKYVAPERLALLRQAVASGMVSFERGLLEQVIVPKPGSVVAAPAPQPPEPDYFFHWVRDSAIVMRELADLELSGAAPRPEDLGRRLADFTTFSRELQSSPSPAGLGEVRYNADGTQDFLKWSRPQLDGPALRALALMRYAETPRSAGVAEAVTPVLCTDLDFIASNWTHRGFDLWEEYNGHDYYALSVQAGALEEGARWAAEIGDDARAKEYAAQRSRILDVLDGYWSNEKGYLSFFHGPTTYWDQSIREKPGGNLDSAVLLAALHGRRRAGRHSLMDERVLATVVKLEDLFASLYLVNRGRAPGDGVVIGRYEGDTYHGGNPFVFTTLGFAEVHYRLALILARAEHFQITSLNSEFVHRALVRAESHEPLEPGIDALAVPRNRAALLRGLVLRGDDVLRAVYLLVRWKAGGLSEQFVQEIGAGPSSHDLSWSHAAFLSATDARREAVSLLLAGPG